MSNWAENPRNLTNEFAEYALPKLIYQDCFLYCVEDPSTHDRLTES
jgi:hypothetical protein